MFSSCSSQNWASESFQRFESFCSQMGLMTPPKLFDMKPFDPFPMQMDMRPFSESFSDNFMPMDLFSSFK